MRSLRKNSVKHSHSTPVLWAASLYSSEKCSSLQIPNKDKKCVALFIPQYDVLCAAFKPKAY